MSLSVDPNTLCRLCVTGTLRHSGLYDQSTVRKKPTGNIRSGSWTKYKSEKIEDRHTGIRSEYRGNSDRVTNHVPETFNSLRYIHLRTLLDVHCLFTTTLPTKSYGHRSVNLDPWGTVGGDRSRYYVLHV